MPANLLFSTFIKKSAAEGHSLLIPNPRCTFRFHTYPEKEAGCSSLNCYNNIKISTELIILNLIAPLKLCQTHYVGSLFDMF